MKTKILFFSIFLLGTFAFSCANAQKEETRNVSVFSEIGLRIPATLYLEQAEQQSVRIIAKESVLKEIITEVKGNKLIFRFPTKNIFKRNKNHGKIEIHVSVPEVNSLNVSGAGYVIANNLKAYILSMAVSGSGDIRIDDLRSKKVKGAISGSGDIRIAGNEVADELTVAISGSGNFIGDEFEAESVKVSIAGSGDCKVNSNGTIKAKIAGSGDVFYNGNPNIESSVAGSGKVKEM